MTKIKSYNSLYGFIENNLFIIDPTTLALSGGITFGLPGVFLGLGASVIDEGLLLYGLTEKKYLTNSFIGSCLGYTIYPSYIASGLSSAVGFFISKGVISKSTLDFDITYPVISMIAGLSKGGIQGVLTGGTIGVADELFIYFNATDKHYLTYALVGITVSSLVGNSAIVAAGGVALGAIFVYFEDDVDISISPANLSQDLYLIYSRILEPDQLANLTIAHTKTLLVSRVILQQLVSKILHYHQEIVYNFEHTDDNNLAFINKFNVIALKFLLFMIPFTIFELAYQTINNYYSTKLYLEVDNQLNNILFANETALKLSFDKDYMVLIDNLKSDSRVVAFEGTKLLTDLVSRDIKSMLGFTVLMTSSPDLLIFCVIYNQITQYVSKTLTVRLSELDTKMKYQESMITTTLKHDMQNIKIINERGGVDYTKNKLSKLYDQLRVFELEKDQIILRLEEWAYFVSDANFIYNYYLVGFKMSYKEIPFDARVNIHYSSQQVSKLLSWKGDKSQEIKKIHQSMERLNLFINKTQNSNDGTESNIQKDGNKITRVLLDDNQKGLASLQSQMKSKLILSNLKISIKDKLLIEIDYLELYYGKIYALTGPTGIGKSSLISKIAGIEGNQIDGVGTIYYPHNAKVVTISQQDYFPLNVTLGEAIFYPEDINNDRIQEVQNLLKEIGITQYNINQTKNWYDVLSGGQKKMVIIISAIIKNPQILLLDEAFNGLDEDSIIIIQNLIKLYLHDSLILSVDHNAKENNKTGFYSNMLSIIDHKIISEVLVEENNQFPIGLSELGIG
jgi:ABC-type uncharacterized transport system fused permease/ATPase subunit